MKLSKSQQEILYKKLLDDKRYNNIFYGSCLECKHAPLCEDLMYELVDYDIANGCASVKAYFDMRKEEKLELIKEVEKL